MSDQTPSMPPLPASYDGGSLVSDRQGGATLRLGFTNAEEAAQWFQAISDRYDADHGAKAFVVHLPPVPTLSLGTSKGAT